MTLLAIRANVGPDVSEPNQFTLLQERRFLPFFVTQALGAFNDNVFKNALIVLVTYQAGLLELAASPNFLPTSPASFSSCRSWCFPVLPGNSSERFDKSRVIQSVKAAEIGIMAARRRRISDPSSAAAVECALFMMGLHSTFFAPAKYGLLPQVLGVCGTDRRQCAVGDRHLRRDLCSAR